jgi:DNA-directed RNA polymerase specialized sigma24 family protein
VQARDQATAMSFELSQSEELTTREAALFTGRTQNAVKSALGRGQLHGRRELDGWRVTRAEVLAWVAQTRKVTRPSSRPWDRAAELLEEFGSLAPQEMAPLLDRHEGNARKYLAILRAEGRAERLPDGQWVLTKRRQVGAA